MLIVLGVDKTIVRQSCDGQATGIVNFTPYGGNDTFYDGKVLLLITLSITSFNILFWAHYYYY